MIDLGWGKWNRRLAWAAVLLAGACLTGTSGAHASDDSKWEVSPTQTAQTTTTTTTSDPPKNLLTRQFTLIAGGFFSFSNTDISVNNKNTGGSGTNINMEDDLGLDEFEATPFVEARWRITPHHRVEFGLFPLDRDGSATAETELIIDDLVVPIGARVDSKLDLVLGRITYGYSFINDGKKEAGVMIGAHVVSVDYNVSLAASIGDTTTDVTSAGEEVTAPLPHIGVMGGYAFNDNLILDGRLVGFYLSISDYTGWLLEAETKLTYMIWDNVGIGLGARYFRFNLEADTSDIDGELDFSFIGPTAFAVVTF